jgi:hypothetical protein
MQNNALKKKEIRPTVPKASFLLSTATYIIYNIYQACNNHYITDHNKNTIKYTSTKAK